MEVCWCEVNSSRLYCRLEAEEWFWTTLDQCIQPDFNSPPCCFIVSHCNDYVFVAVVCVIDIKEKLQLLNQAGREALTG